MISYFFKFQHMDHLPIPRWNEKSNENYTYDPNNPVVVNYERPYFSVHVPFEITPAEENNSLPISTKGMEKTYITIFSETDPLFNFFTMLI